MKAMGRNRQDDALPSQIQRAAAWLMESCGRCFLCDSPRVYAIGAFHPDEPRLYTNLPLRPGKRRVLMYALCRPCFKKAKRTRGVVVENKILAEQAARGTVH